MPDIILAELTTNAWLVRGEQYIDDLLANTLPPHITIEVVTCESKSAVDTMWRDNGGTDPSEMWLIHPAIVNRARGVGTRYSIYFAPWSASLEARSLGTIASIAETLTSHAERDGAGVLALIRHVAPKAPAMATDLANLRTGLIEQQLASLGVPPSHLVRETQDSETDEQSDRIDLVVRPA